MQNRIRSSFALLLLFALLLSFSPSLRGLASTAAIAGTVFLDSNQNGLPDPNERGLEGVELTLVRAQGLSESIIGQVKSDREGWWQFTGLAAGEYYVQASLPGGHTFSVPKDQVAPMLPASGQHSHSGLIILGEGEQVDRSFGAGKRSAYINMVAFGDENMNGGRMSSEPLLRGVEVALIFEQGGQQHVVTQGQTDKDGELQFRNLSPATYRIRVRMPAPYVVGPLGAKINPFYNVVLPGEADTGLSAPFTLERSLGLGIGGVKAGGLSGHVWLDSNMNGQKDQGEGGLAGIQLTLENAEHGVHRNLVTSDEPAFTFDYLLAGTYSLTASLPDGVMFTPAGLGLFDAGHAGEQTIQVLVQEDVTAVLDPLGLMPASGVTLVAFQDSKVNGQPEEGEPPFTGALLEVLQGDQVLASARTDSQGLASLPRVRAGEVQLRASLPDGQVFTVAGGENGNAFAATSAASTLTITRQLAPGEQITLYAGATLPSSISGMLFEDINLSGLMDGQETGLGGFPVEAINTEGQTAAQARTQADGSYVLEGLVPDSYRVRFSLVSPYVFSEPSTLGQGTENRVVEQTVTHGLTAPFTLAAGDSLTKVDAGVFRSAVIEGQVLLGDEELGFESQLGGLMGVQVDLLDEDGKLVAEHTTAMTNDQGFFSLKGALPGTYSLRYSRPEGARFSQPLSDHQAITGLSFEVLASDSLTAPTVYAVRTASLSGRAFHDVDNDGQLTREDSGLAGARLTLTNQRSQEVYETQTDDQGAYLLDGVRPGVYEVLVALPEGYALDSNPGSLVPASISGQSTALITLGMGDEMAEGRLAALRPISLQGAAFYDNDLNNSFDPQEDIPHALGFTLTHLRSGTLTTLTADPAGQFAAGPLFPGDYRLTLRLEEGHLLTHPRGAAQQQNSWTVDLRLLDDSSRLDLALVQLGSLSGSLWNMDGSGQDIAQVAISLMDEQGRELAQTQTDDNGQFRFDGLLPVSYRLRASLAEPYRFARLVDTAERPSLILSDQVGQDASQGMSEPIKLGMGEDKAGQDIGMGAMGKLGDYAWLDLDGDGMQDTGEPGLPGLVIKLYQYGQLSAQTQTDGYGRYLFDQLYPGVYTLEVEMPPEIIPTKRQSEFPLVASVLEPTQDKAARAEGIVVPSGGRNLNADLGFVLRQEGRYPQSLADIPVKDWTRVNEQKPSR